MVPSCGGGDGSRKQKSSFSRTVCVVWWLSTRFLRGTYVETNDISFVVVCVFSCILFFAGGERGEGEKDGDDEGDQEAAGAEGESCEEAEAGKGGLRQGMQHSPTLLDKFAPILVHPKSVLVFSVTHVDD